VHGPPGSALGTSGEEGLNDISGSEKEARGQAASNNPPRGGVAARGAGLSSINGSGAAAASEEDESHALSSIVAVPAIPAVNTFAESRGTESSSALHRSSKRRKAEI